jgi:hypothetical protein
MLVISNRLTHAYASYKMCALTHPTFFLENNADLKNTEKCIEVRVSIYLD